MPAKDQSALLTGLSKDGGGKAAVLTLSVQMPFGFKVLQLYKV